MSQSHEVTLLFFLMPYGLYVLIFPLHKLDTKPIDACSVPMA